MSEAQDSVLPIEAATPSAELLPLYLRRLAQAARDNGRPSIALNATGARAIADELERCRAEIAELRLSCDGMQAANASLMKRIDELGMLWAETRAERDAARAKLAEIDRRDYRLRIEVDDLHKALGSPSITAMDPQPEDTILAGAVIRYAVRAIKKQES